MTKGCTCIEYEDQGVIPDPDCSIHRKGEEEVMGEHSGDRMSIRDMFKVPKEHEGSKIGWYIGMFIAAILLCAGLVLVGAIIIGLVRLFFFVVAWLVG